VVVQRAHDVGEGFFDVEEVGDEAGVRVDRSVQLDLDPVGMTMQPAASIY